MSGLRVAAILLCVAAPGWAQSGTASLSGHVLDPSGAVLPGASATVTNMATAAMRSTVTNESGVYRWVGSMRKNDGCTIRGPIE